MSSLQSNKRIAKNTAFLYLRMAVVLIISIYTTRVVLSVLGVEDFGVYNVVCGFVSMFSFLNTSMSNGTQRFYNFELGKGNYDGYTKVYCTSLIIQFIIACAVLLILETIGIWYINHKLIIADAGLKATNIVFQCSVFSLVILILGIPYSAAILSYERMGYYSIVSIIDVALKLVIVIVLPYIPLNKLAFYGFLQLIVAICNFLLYYVYATHNIHQLKFNWEIKKGRFKEILSFSGWNLLPTSAWIAQSQGINLIINLFVGPLANAARGVSAQIQAAIQSFCENLVIAFRPQLVQSYSQGNYNRTKKMMYSMSKVMFMLYFLLSTPVIFNIEYILNIWLGNNIPEYTVQFTILILLSMYPRNFVMALAQVVHATGKIKRFQIVTFVIVISLLPLSYIFLEMGYNVVTVFVLNIIVCSLMFVICLFSFIKVFPIRIKEYLLEVITPCVSMATISVIGFFIISKYMQETFLRLVIDCAFSVFISLPVAYFLIFNKSEQELIKKIIFRR